MKKLISVLLSIVMVLALTTTAFATEIEVRKDVAYKAENATVNDKANTELWLQVEASGQIDVTVPLVLVFKTNIDGGAAVTADNYKITNNSSADVAVTAMKTTLNADQNPMTLDAYTTADLARDHYKVQLTAGQKSWDLHTAEHTALAKDGGLFGVAKDGSSPVKVDMTTGKLSFVTKGTDYGVKLLNVSYTVAIDTQNAIGTEITK